MANTIMSAKNSFQEGLIMDFSPDNTQATCMTSALNATLLTFNGNEMLLQNDMGNGRVETAYLPEGYMPVGTCEFGDIIYIVSYNPILNKSLIGCFPSPERNITSEEVGNLSQSLNTNEFLYFGNAGPSGKLKNTSVKKIIFEKSLNPGDKYIVYSTPELLYNYDKLTDFGNVAHLYSDWPKLLKLHVVAIEDSGKINYLDTDVHWYTNIYKEPGGSGGPGGDSGGDEGGGGGGGGGSEGGAPEEEGIPVIDPNARPMRMMRFMAPLPGNAATFALERAEARPNDYFILQLSTTNTSKPDIDSYRSLVSSAYSVFLSKVSGKLAILAELEKITGFSCTHNIYTKSNSNTKDYSVYLNCSWETDNYNVNPSGFVVTNSTWKEDGGYYKVHNSDPINLEVPIQAHTASLEDKFIFTSDYNLASPGTYEDFVNNSCYLALSKNFENRYNKDDLNYMPRKITLALLDKHPYITTLSSVLISHYYINAFDTNNGALGFYNSKGTFQNILGNALYDNVQLTDTFVHNYFGKDITKLFYKLSGITNYVQSGDTKYYSDLTSLVHNYTVCPAMPYGYLEELSVSNSIDFSKVGSGLINLKEWRYYNDGEIGTLTVGFDAYPEENKGINYIDLEFYDNLGLVTVLKLQGKQSYSGTFTEVFLFNNPTNRSFSSEGIIHKGDGPYVLDNPDSEDYENMQKMVALNIYILEGQVDGLTAYYLNDAGVIYPNLLYLVKIKVYYLSKNALGGFDDSDVTPITFVRWYWSNTMYNDRYHNIKDFNDLEINLDINLLAAFGETSALGFKNELVTNSSMPESFNEEIPILYLSLGYNKFSVYSDSTNGNIKMGILPVLNDSYDTFTILDSVYKNISYKIWEGEKTIELPTSITLKSSEDSPFIKYPELLYPISGSKPLGDPERPGNNDSLASFETWYKSLVDWFNLDIKSGGTRLPVESVEYVTIKDTVKTLNEQLPILISAEGARPDNSLLLLLLEGEYYSKIMANASRPYPIECTTYRPFIASADDLAKYNIITTATNVYTSNNSTALGGTLNIFSFEKIYNIAMKGKNGDASCFYGITGNNGLIKVGDKHESFGLVMEGKVGGGDSEVKLSISDSLKANSVDIGPFSILSTSALYTDSDERESEGDLIKCRMNTLKNFDATYLAISLDWLNTWGSYNQTAGNDKDAKYYILQGGVLSNFESNKRGPMTTMLFVAKDITGKYVPFNAFGRTCNGEGNVATQAFGSFATTSSIVGGFKSFADIVASLLAQLYYKSEITETKNINVFSDTIVNNPYTTLWSKEFIIKCVGTQDQINNSIGILGIPYGDYIRDIKTHIKNGEKYSDCNITINTDAIVKRSNLIQFVYTTNYDIQEMIGKYIISVDSQYYMAPDITKSYGGKFITSVPSNEILALDISTNELAAYNGIASNRLVIDNYASSGFRWSEQNGTDIIDFSKLIEKLTVKEEMAILKNTVIGQDMYKLSFSRDDKDHEEGEKLAQGFSSTIVLNKLFAI